jgi:N,N'-diacetylchitobiose transport system permease protein
VFSFIPVWNEDLIASVLLSRAEMETLGIWLASFTTNHGTEWGAVMAGSTLFAIPAVLFFLLVQRRVVSGLTAGAVKG